MKETLTNLEIDARLKALDGVMDTTGLLAYAIARNNRRLSDASLEYLKMRDELVKKYGTEEDGKFTLLLSSPNFKKFERELEPIAQATTEVDIYQIDAREAAEQLTARQMISIDWMLKDSEVDDGASSTGD